MVKIVGTNGTGKTTKLLKTAAAMYGIVVCGNPKQMFIDAENLDIDIPEEDFWSYDHFLAESRVRPVNRAIYIDDLEDFILKINNNIDGYTYNI